MIFIIDTCTWLKLDLLNENQAFNPNYLYEWIEIEITHQILKELEYYNCNSFQKEKTKIIPIENEKIYQNALTVNFDDADASLLSCGKKSSISIIVSEDGLLLEYARIHNYFALQLIDLLQILTTKRFIAPRNLYHLTKLLRELDNITKKKEKEILKYRLQLPEDELSWKLN